MSTSELNRAGFSDAINNGAVSFISNGEIYINTDVATVDAPIHEILHVLVGSIKFQNPQLYESLTSLSQNFENYNRIARLYPNRTQQDINEEVFVNEFAKYITGNSQLDNLPENIQYEIVYNITRLLDSMLMGDSSVRNIPINQLYQMSLREIAQTVNSAIMSNSLNFNLSDAEISRTLANKKQELMESNELKEVCK